MRELDPGGPGAGRGTGRKHAAAVGIAALCLLAFTTLLSLHRESNSAMELADPKTESAGEYAGSTQKLYQIGNQEYLSMNTGSVEDIADEVQKKLGKELIMLKKIEKAANKGKRVFIKIEAGQIGKRGGPGPQGDAGPMGFQGPRGPRGWRGPQGPRGDTGPIGIKGPKGQDGDDGEHGDTGDPGPVGPVGPSGRRGREGRRGPEGSLGKNGDPGPPGKEGPSGKRGAAGADGARGPKGPPGPPGKPGRAGDEGAPGDKGATGATGQQGSQGKPGAAGPPGDAGTSVCGINTQLGKQMCCGKVEPSDIQADSDFNHFATVNMAQCKFTGQPVVFTSVTCNSQCWFISSTANIMTESNVMSAKDFKLYLRTPIGVSLGEVKSMQWTIQWCAFGESTAAPKPQQVCCGSSAPSSWTNFNNRGIYTDVNAAGCEFKTNPMFFTSITDKACGSELMGSGRCTAKGIGANSIYSTSQSGFRVYTQPVPGDPVDYQESTARANGWQINWCGVANLDPSAAPSGKAGYPCTSPRLLKGSNAQEVFSNTGEICCDTTSAAGWKQAGAMAISKEVDISACGFEVVSYTLLNVRGDNPLQMTSGASSWAPTSDATKITVYLQTNGKYKFYNAEQYYWKVQYCMFGK